MRRGVPANRQQTEIVGRAPIERGDPRTDVVAVFINGSSRRPSIARRYRLEEGPRRLVKSFVRIHGHVGVMIDGDELQLVDEQHFLELVGDAQFVAAVSSL